MMSTSSDSPRDGSRAERGLLSALCQGSLSPQARERVLRRLERHRFSTPECEVIFLAASKLSMGETGDVREALLAGLTRLGFPDIDIEAFFNEVAPTERELPGLFDQL